MSRTLKIILVIKRFNPDEQKTWRQKYEIEVGKTLRFVDVFRRINRDLDPTLAWNSSCEHAQCGTCAIKVNGKPLLACELLVENAIAQFGTNEFVIEPITVAPVVRDLIVDLEQAYRKVDKAKPYLIDPIDNHDELKPNRISPQEMDAYIDASRCINCFCCATACISSEKGFLGPNAVLASILRIMDPREQEIEERWKLLFSEEGVYRCHTSQACSFVCPKEIDVSHYIALAKEGKIGLEKKRKT